ncbi:MAG: dihydroorotate dehydrogenase electron transfer subunit [Candidatus Zixiibacteriota bacterium]
MISLFSSPVLSKENLQERIFKLTLFSPLVSKKARPGSFIHLKVGSDHFPLLRRAFSIHDVNVEQKSFDILFKVVGTGTDLLSKVAPGDTLSILGPIGNSFALPPKGKEIVLVAGGMGVAPLWFFLKRLKSRFRPERLTFFLGARTKKELLYVEKIRSAKVRLTITTDDGSLGRRGRVTEVFDQGLSKRNLYHRNLAVYSCGPHMMLRRMSEIAKTHDLFCQVSLETHMPCGVGACWGCVVRLTDGTYQRVCVDGPVFDAREVDLG